MSSKPSDDIGQVSFDLLKIKDLSKIEKVIRYTRSIYQKEQTLHPAVYFLYSGIIIYQFWIFVVKNNSTNL